MQHGKMLLRAGLKELELQCQQILHYIHEMDGYCVETDDDIETQAFQDAKLQLHETYASSVIDVS